MVQMKQRILLFPIYIFEVKRVWVRICWKRVESQRRVYRAKKVTRSTIGKSDALCDTTTTNNK